MDKEGKQLRSNQKENEGALLEAAEQEDEAKVRKLLSKGTNPRYTPYEKGNSPPLIIASPYPSILKLLIETGTDINAEEINKSYTALIRTAKTGNIDSAACLLTLRHCPMPLK
jgi:ankyrin repeat protein